MRLIFKQVYRNYLKSKKISLVNTLSFVLGITLFIIVYQYVTYERSYDSYDQENSMFRVYTEKFYDNRLVDKTFFTVAPIGPTLVDELPEVVESARLYDIKMNMVRYKENSFHEKYAFLAETSILKTFPLKIIDGDTTNLDGNVIISQSTAKKYFGDESPIGKQLNYNNWFFERDYLIKGVYEDLPKNSHIKFDLLFFTYNEFARKAGFMGNWDYDRNVAITYIKTEKGIKADDLQNKIDNVLSKYRTKDNSERGKYYEIRLEPVREIHLYSDVYDDIAVNKGDIKNVKILITTAIILMFMLWINYMNLNSSRAIERAKEVGVKKVMGASKAYLFKQFLFEVLIFNIFVILISLALIVIANNLLIKYNIVTVNFNIWTQPLFYLVLLLILLIGTFFSGVLPSLLMSAFRPVDILKGKFSRSILGETLRKGFLVIQFTLITVLIFGTITIFTQHKFMMNKDLGFNKDHILVFTSPITISELGAGINKMNSFINDLEQYTDIKSVANSVNVPGSWIEGNAEVSRLMNDKTLTSRTKLTYINHAFLNAYEIELLAGNNFKQNNNVLISSDEIIINETTLHELGFKTPQEAIDEFVDIPVHGETVKTKIIGVIRDYHHFSLHEKIQPFIYYYVSNAGMYYSFKLKEGSNPFKTIQEGFQNYFPEIPFDEYFYLDKYYDVQYKEFNYFEKFFFIVVIICVLVGCAGLYSLTAYNLLNMSKFACIHKVHGATLTDVMVQQLVTFLRFSGISLIVGLPIAYTVFDKWLMNYAYRININTSYFIYSAIILLTIVFLTIIYDVQKYAKTSPADILRYE